MEAGERVRIGDDTLDDMLGGGLPKGWSVLVTGGPGTGTSTLAMQFLQEGLERGDNCLSVNTEQTIPELRDSFSGFDFELNHENLSFTSVHAKPGQTIEGDGELTLSTLDDGLQYLTLRKSPWGFVGSTSLVEYVDEPPYLRVQRPPQTRENSYTCE